MFCHRRVLEIHQVAVNVESTEFSAIQSVRTATKCRSLLIYYVNTTLLYTPSRLSMGQRALFAVKEAYQMFTAFIWPKHSH